MRIPFFGLLAMAFLCFSCVQYHYTPNFIQTPAIEKKGDGVIYGGLNLDFNGRKGDFHASFSPVPHISLVSNFLRVNTAYTHNDFSAPSSYRYKEQGHLWEAGIGGYYPIGFGTVAVYAGYGVGRMRNDYDLGRVADLRLERYYLQPTYTFKTKHVRLGIGMRVARLHYPQANIDYRIDQSEIDVLKRIEQDSPFLMTEFGGTIGYYQKPFFFSMHGLISAHPGWASYNFDASNVGMGIGVELQDIKFKKKEKSATKLRNK